MEHRLLESFNQVISHEFKSIVACVLVGEVGLNFYTMLSRQAERRRICLENVSLLDQCKTRYYQRISFGNEIQDAPQVCASSILGKGRRMY
jgi:hypothetical protein